VLLGLPEVHVAAVERHEATMTVIVSTTWQLMGSTAGWVRPTQLSQA